MADIKHKTNEIFYTIIKRNLSPGILVTQRAGSTHKLYMDMNELQVWNLTAKWELNHEKGVAEFSLMDGEKVIQSMKYVQGMYFDQNNKLMGEKDAEAFKWLIRKLK